jgi:thiol-disulfide isomerase/thioredoxin
MTDKLQNVLELKNKDFDKDLNLINKEAKPKTIILYYADWCGHCNHLKPTYQKLIEMSNSGKLDASVAAVNSDNSDGLLERINKMGENAEYEVRGFPTIVSYHNGKYFSSYAPDDNEEGRKKFRTLEDMVDYINGIGTANITYVDRR